MNFKDLNPDLWYVKWFFWSLGIYTTFQNDFWSERRIRENGTNLCFFGRTTLITAPVIIMLHVFMYVSAVLVLTIVPIRYFGGSGYLWILAAISVLCLVIFGMKRFYAWGREARYARRNIHRPTPQIMARGPNFFDVLGQWRKAVHEKICPLVTFTQQPEEEK